MSRTDKECADCGQAKTITARGLCDTCYQRNRANGQLDKYTPARKPAKTIVCADCGRVKKHSARGLCSACWQRNKTHGTLHLYGGKPYGPQEKTVEHQQAIASAYQETAKAISRQLRLKPDRVVLRHHQAQIVIKACTYVAELFKQKAETK